MGKQHKHYPPIETRGKRVMQLLSRALVNLFVVVALASLFFLLFATILDTPAEYRMRQSMQALDREYTALSERMEEIDVVLSNVVERDRNVFNILFEAEPYTMETEVRPWHTRGELASKTNSELAQIYFSKQAVFDKKVTGTDSLISNTYIYIRDMGDRANALPSIQPILNNELTLLTASFGMRIQPYYKVLTMHNGVDYTVPEGTRVFATADGRVKSAESRPSSTGNAIVIDHGNGYETRYHHLSKMLVKKGQKVRRGDIIAITGNTGLSLIPHLHYEIRRESIPVDPVHYFFAELGPEEYRRILSISQSGMQSFD